MSEEPTKLTALISGCVRIASTETLSPCTQLSTPSGAPASRNNSARRSGTDGSFSDGFRINVFPHAIATANIQHGIMAGKLNGVIPATTPSGWRMEYTSIPGPAPSVYSPFCKCGIPQANSTTSMPRCTSPRLSATTLPCSDESSSANSSILSSSNCLKRNITRARRCGLVAAQPGKAAFAD